MANVCKQCFRGVRAPPVTTSDPEAAVVPSPTATTGVAELDAALGGLFWGDNVVWEADEDGLPEPFYRAVADVRGHRPSPLSVLISSW